MKSKRFLRTWNSGKRRHNELWFDDSTKWWKRCIYFTTTCVPQKQNDDQAAETPVSTSTTAASLPQSRTNPSGQTQPKTVANGKDSVANTARREIQSCIDDLGNVFKTAKIYDPKNTSLTKDLDSESQFVPVSRASTFPPRGKVKIGGEVIGYNGTNSYGLTLVKRGMEKSKIKSHKKGTKG